MSRHDNRSNDSAIQHHTAQTAVPLRISTQVQEANRTDAQVTLIFDTEPYNKGET